MALLTISRDPVGHWLDPLEALAMLAARDGDAFMTKLESEQHLGRPLTR
jgi:hypothetical protein